MFIDSHCHIHESDYPLATNEVLRRAAEAGVTKMICVGTNETSSRDAVLFAGSHEGVYASVGVHPHEALAGYQEVARLAADATVPQNNKRLVAIGEIGLDYYYSHSPKDAQIEALQAQIEVALRYDLPVIFHVREAFEDFWPIIDAFHGIRGVLHSFTDSERHLEEGLKRGFYIGVNGISTFTKNEAQRAMFAHIPLERLILETDAPYLTPSPLRGKVNEPAFVGEVARHQATVRNCPVADVAAITTANADALFALI